MNFLAILRRIYDNQSKIQILSLLFFAEFFSVSTLRAERYQQQ
jgi:hypothetical protein